MISKGSLKTPDYNLSNNSKLRQPSIKEDDIRAGFSTTTKLKSSESNGEKESVRFESKFEERNLIRTSMGSGELLDDDNDLTPIPGYDKFATEDNLPESPSFPKGRFNPFFPIKGAFNHIQYRKHQYYTLSARGVVTKRIDKISKTKSIRRTDANDGQDNGKSTSSMDKLAASKSKSDSALSSKSNMKNFPGKSPGKNMATSPLIEITKKKSRLAHRDKLIKDLQDIQRKLNVLEDRAIQLQEDKSSKTEEELDEVEMHTNLIQMTEDILEALASINQRLEIIGKTSFDGL